MSLVHWRLNHFWCWVIIHVQRFQIGIIELMKCHDNGLLDKHLFSNEAFRWVFNEE